MSQQVLYTKIFGTQASEQPEARLNEITSRYPYFSAAQYFLLQHTARDSAKYDLIAGRTALHFNNPFYLNYLLHNEYTPGTLQQPDDHMQVAEPITEKKAGDNEVQHADPIKRTDKRNQDELMFEPLHTTDYFASQGIKLSEEVKPDDKLGKQLRSFTDWLKTMKKVHEEKLPGGNPAIDLTVQSIADKSNQEGEVITESMADVYKEQGKKAKAREIYQKLSLLDPSKSAYFAAKIDSLKDL